MTGQLKAGANFKLSLKCDHNLFGFLLVHSALMISRTRARDKMRQSLLQRVLFLCVKSAGYFPRVHSALSSAINLLQQTTFSDFLHRSTESQKMPLAAGVVAAAANDNKKHKAAKISRRKQTDDENE